MISLIDEEVDAAVKSVIEKYSFIGFDQELYANIYVETIMTMVNRDDITNRYGYAYSVAKNLIKAILTNSVITAIKD